MSDYSITTDFSVKDALDAGESEKLIIGSDFDTEFEAIKTAVNTKYDSGDLASQAQAEAESSNTVLMTPLRLANWGDENGGLVGEIQELADPNADGLVGWDDSASANANVVYFTAGTALAFSGTTIEMSHLGIEDLADPGADRIIFWDDGAGKTDFLVANTGLAISGTNLNLSFLGIEALTDPNADKIFAWDDSAGATKFMGAGLGLSINSTPDLNINIGTTTESTVAPDYNDEILIEVDGTLKSMDLSVALAMPITRTVVDSTTLLAADIGAVVRCNKGSAMNYTIDTNANVTNITGTWTIVENTGAGVVTRVAPAGGSANCAGGVLTIAAQWGRVVLHNTATDVWTVNGDLG